MIVILVNIDPVIDLIFLFLTAEHIFLCSLMIYAYSIVSFALFLYLKLIKLCMFSNIFIHLFSLCWFFLCSIGYNFLIIQNLHNVIIICPVCFADGICDFSQILLI